MHSARSHGRQFHARYDDGRQAWADDEISRTILATAARDVDPLAYPGYAGNLDHIWALAEHPPAGTALLLAPFDPLNTSSVCCGRRTKTSSKQSIPTIRTVRTRLTRPSSTDLPSWAWCPSISVFNDVDLRWVILAARIGILRQPLNIKLFFSDRWVSYSDPDPDVLDYLVSRIPKWVDHEIVVVPYAMSSAERRQELWEHALNRGLGIRVGIGDCPRYHGPPPTPSWWIARSTS